MKYLQSEAISLFESWWRNENDQALFGYQYPKQSRVPERLRREWMPPGDFDGNWVGMPWLFGHLLDGGDYAEIDALLEVITLQQSEEQFLGCGFPRVFPNCGPGCLSAFTSGFVLANKGDIWYELGGHEPGFELEEIPSLDESRGQKIIEIVTEIMQRSNQHTVGIIPVSMTDLGGNLDTLAALRGAQDLLMDLIDQPEMVQASLEKLDMQWLQWYSRFDRIISESSSSCRSAWMQILSEKPFYPLQCDFGALLSPEMFNEFVRPSLQRIGQGLGRAVFHLDGPAMQGHLPYVFEVPEVHGVQWTPGAGNPDVYDECWFDLYRTIIEGGRKVILLCFPPDAEALQRLFRALPSKEFYIHVEGPDREIGEALQRLVDKQ